MWGWEVFRCMRHEVSPGTISLVKRNTGKERTLRSKSFPVFPCFCNWLLLAILYIGVLSLIIVCRDSTTLTPTFFARLVSAGGALVIEYEGRALNFHAG